jgi:hypothetical protein
VTVLLDDAPDHGVPVESSAAQARVAATAVNVTACPFRRSSAQARSTLLRVLVFVILRWPR